MNTAAVIEGIQQTAAFVPTWKPELDDLIGHLGEVSGDKADPAWQVVGVQVACRYMGTCRPMTAGDAASVVTMILKKAGLCYTRKAVLSGKVSSRPKPQAAAAPAKADTGNRSGATKRASETTGRAVGGDIPVVPATPVRKAK